MTEGFRTTCSDLAGLLEIVGQYDHVIWDWNGTLLDDVDCCHRTIEKLLSNHGLSPITLEEYRAVFHFPVIDYYKELGFDFNQLSFENIALEWVAIYENLQDDARLFPGMRDLLIKLSGMGICSHILTAAREVDVERLAENFHIRSFFASIHGLDNHHAVSKIDRGRELITFIGRKASRVILVGDTDHDAEVALDLGIDCVLLDEGHQEGRDHSRIEAAFIINGKTLRHFSRKPIGEV